MLQLYEAVRVLYHRPELIFFSEHWITFSDFLYQKRLNHLLSFACAAPPEVRGNTALTELQVLVRAILGIQKSMKILQDRHEAARDYIIFNELRESHSEMMDRIDCLRVRLHLDFLQIEKELAERNKKKEESLVAGQAEDFDDSDTEQPIANSCNY